MTKEFYKVGSFKDYAGTERQVVFCAIINFGSDKYLSKEIRIGFSVQSPEDKPNETLGKVIAKGKALKNKSVWGIIYTTNSGLINSVIIQKLLEEELSHFQNNPGRYIKGYDAWTLKCGQN